MNPDLLSFFVQEGSFFFFIILTIVYNFLYSYAQLRAVFEAYTKRTGHSLSNDIESEFSGDIKKALLSISIDVFFSFLVFLSKLLLLWFLVDCIIDKQAHFAELLYKAIKGLGTNEACIIRVLVSRCEIDMVQIKKKFQDLYKESLVDWLKVLFF